MQAAEPFAFSPILADVPANEHSWVQRSHVLQTLRHGGAVAHIGEHYRRDFATVASKWQPADQF
jgi:hypothetical protein